MLREILKLVIAIVFANRATFKKKEKKRIVNEEFVIFMLYEMEIK